MQISAFRVMIDRAESMGPLIRGCCQQVLVGWSQEPKARLFQKGIEIKSKIAKPQRLKSSRKLFPMGHRITRIRHMLQAPPKAT